LPGGDVIDMSQLEGFDELTHDQQRFLIKYLEMFPRKYSSAMAVKVTNNQLQTWEKDPNFAQIMNVIKQMYAESLSSVHLEEAFENSKIRGQVLRALNAEGYEAKESTKVGTQNNLVVGDGGGLAGLLSQIKS